MGVSIQVNNGVVVFFQKESPFFKKFLICHCLETTSIQGPFWHAPKVAVPYISTSDQPFKFGPDVFGFTVSDTSS
jgi:hypothetical protein